MDFMNYTSVFSRSRHLNIHPDVGWDGRELGAMLMEKLIAAKVEKFPKYSAATTKKV